MGLISKTENLTTVKHNVFPNTFVLENMEPFPGYHGENLPTDSIPMSVFLITKLKYPAEKILRISQNIKKYFKHEFDATYGELFIYNDCFSCIRIKGLKSYDFISELQCCYLDEGIKFMKKKNISASGIIQVYKHFVLEQIDEGLYKDCEDPLMNYFQIPVQLKWELFEKITYSIKNNIENSNFDAALGFIYFREIIDVVRIYAKEMNPEKLKILRDSYINGIRKFHQ